ncbi:hypothetical protein, partial [Ornithinimicrobium sp.]|uniref:hypothetical protein n=1 Tax=Ornithinimicrobium sp. TaxID=1977084 RepID=UPI003D9AD930
MAVTVPEERDDSWPVPPWLVEPAWFAAGLDSHDVCEEPSWFAAAAREEQGYWDQAPVLSPAEQQDSAETLGQSWASPTPVGLVRVQEGLSQVGLPDGVAQALLAVVRCAAAHAQADVSPGTA